MKFDFIDIIVFKILVIKDILRHGGVADKILRDKVALTRSSNFTQVVSSAKNLRLFKIRKIVCTLPT